MARQNPGGVRESDALASAIPNRSGVTTPNNRSIELSDDAPSFIIKVIKPGEKHSSTVKSQGSDISPSVAAQRKLIREDEEKIAARLKEMEEQREFERSRPLLE